MLSKPLCVPLECVMLFMRADWPAYPGGIRRLATRRKTTEYVLVIAMDIDLHLQLHQKLLIT